MVCLFQGGYFPFECLDQNVQLTFPASAFKSNGTAQVRAVFCIWCPDTRQHTERTIWTWFFTTGQRWLKESYLRCAQKNWCPVWEWYHAKQLGPKENRRLQKHSLPTGRGERVCKWQTINFICLLLICVAKWMNLNAHNNNFTVAT